MSEESKSLAERNLDLSVYGKHELWREDGKCFWMSCLAHWKELGGSVLIIAGAWFLAVLVGADKPITTVVSSAAIIVIAAFLAFRDQRSEKLKAQSDLSDGREEFRKKEELRDALRNKERVDLQILEAYAKRFEMSGPAFVLGIKNRGKKAATDITLTVNMYDQRCDTICIIGLSHESADIIEPDGCRTLKFCFSIIDECSPQYVVFSIDYLDEGKPEFKELLMRWDGVSGGELHPDLSLVSKKDVARIEEYLTRFIAMTEKAEQPEIENASNDDKLRP